MRDLDMGDLDMGDLALSRLWWRHGAQLLMAAGFASLVWAVLTSAWLLVPAGLFAVAVVHGGRAVARLRSRYARLMDLSRSSEALAATVGTPTLVPVLLTRAVALLHADRAELLLLPSDTGPGSWSSLAAAGMVEERLVFDPDHPALRRLDSPRLRAADPDLLARLDARSSLVVLLGPEQAPDGVLVFALDRLRVRGRRRSAFDSHDIELATSLAAAATIALAQERLLTRVKQESAVREHQALHDPLTGLPNRRKLIQEADEALQRGPLGLLVLDLDRFQDVNDTLGHDVGDLVLLKVVLRLGEHLQHRGATLGRLSGDEFVVLLPGCQDGDLAMEVTMLLGAFDRPITIADTQLLVRATVGVASSSSTSTAARLLQFAESAMYDAKHRNVGVAVHRAGSAEATRRRLGLVRELRRALEQGCLTLALQPQVDLATGRPCAVEVLLRWTTEEEGPISPEEFVALAEQSGMGPDLNRYVLTRALAIASGWAAQGRDLVIAVNVSPRGLADGSLLADVPALLAAHGVAADRLVLELTEGSVMQDPTVSLQVLQRLADLGVGLSIDDFGTGYSSMAYLKRLPVDEVKIDRSFVMNLACDGDDAAIVASTVRLAHDLGLRVVAEGVEEAMAYEALRRLGCDRAQGYLLSRPAPQAEFERWLQTWPEHGRIVVATDAPPVSPVRLAQ